MTQEPSPRLDNILVNSKGDRFKVISSGINSIRVRDLKTGKEYDINNTCYGQYKRG